MVTKEVKRMEEAYLVKQYKLDIIKHVSTATGGYQCYWPVSFSVLFSVIVIDIGVISLLQRIFQSVFFCRSSISLSCNIRKRL